MGNIIARAPAKLNLTFEIVGVLPDGYHEVSTLMQSIDLEDELDCQFSPAEHLSVSLECSGSTTNGAFPLDDSNLIVKTIKLFMTARGGSQGLSARIRVEKNIPISAGLAGGSSDAAATMLALNYHFGHPFSPEELLALGEKLGADVPFCIEGGTRIGRGRGDELAPVESAGHFFFVVLKPKDLAISTAWVYGAFDEWQEACEKPEGWSPPDMVGAVTAFRSGDLELATSCFGNDFEPVVFAHHPDLAEMKKVLLDLGSWCCNLTGSGPTLYAVVPDREMAHAVRRQFFEKHGDRFAVEFRIAESVGYGARLVGEH